MSCGQYLRGRLGRADPALVRSLWPADQIADAPDDEIYGWLWSDEKAARASAHLNSVDHGHGTAVYGPRAVEGGWVVAIDLGPALRRAEAATWQPCEDAGEVKPWERR